MHGDVVLCAVEDLDDERVAVANLEGGSRVLAIHSDDFVTLAQPLHWRCLHLFTKAM